MNEILTGRARDVAVGLLLGMTEKEISEKLKMSPYSVEWYQRMIKKKLGAKTPYQEGYLLGKILRWD